MSYKSVRLLTEAVYKELDDVKKTLMNCEESPSGYFAATQEAQEKLVELRKLIDELAAAADRPTIEDVTKQSAGDYVATMKPLVRRYHQQLMTVDKLAPCLCEDLQATGCVLMLIGDGKTVVRTAVDPNRPEIQLAVEIILQSLDEGMSKVATEGVAEAEKQLGISDDERPLGVLPDTEEPT